MQKPGFSTAIPKRRYKFGEFSVVILGEIESNDGISYSHIAAVVKGADPEPGLYLTAEKGAATAGNDNYNMRMIMRDGAEVIGTSDRWADLDAFSGDVLDVVAQVLNLSDEVPCQLM